MKAIGQTGRLFGEWAVLLIFSVVGAFFLQSSGLTERLDNQVFDSASTLVSPAKSDDIILVGIDDQSLADLGGWPWPRSTHAALLDRLNQAGARAIVLDILFIENGDAADDAALEGALARGGNTVLPHTFTARMDATTGVDPLLPIPAFENAAAGVGYVGAEPDADGILRRFDLVTETDQGEYPHLALKVLEQLGYDTAQYKSLRTALIPFHPEYSNAAYSASDVVNGAALDQYFDGKIVLVGATAQGMGDRYSVASGEVGLMTGIETQANLIGALMADAVIDPAGQLWLTAVAVAALVILFAAFWYVSPKASLYVALALILGVVALSLLSLTLAHIWLPFAPVVIMIGLAYPLWSWRRLSHVSRYLDREAARMMRRDETAQQHSAIGGAKKQRAAQGMEYVARQVEQVRGLIHSIEGSLSFLRQVIEAAPDAMIVVDGRGEVQMLNAKADHLFPEWEQQAALSLNELFLFGRTTPQRDFGELLTEDGRIFLIAKAPLGSLPQAEEGLSGDILALREITDLRRLDQERKQMLEFLSHDMRTPQVAIIGLTRKPEKGSDAPDTMERIKKQAERTLKLADDFVQLARLESPELQLEDCDVGALIEEACDRAYVLAEAKHISIEQQLPAEPCFADVDASLIARMLDNLIGNAVKYSPEDSRITVKLGVTQEGTHQIFVSDEGAGLPEARIKDPFARFGAHATHAGPSAGLGLALVKKVVDAHEGTIEVTSQPGQGTQFAISLAS